jgi:phenylpropionate dioxygenase-like ring-hydroxylating dioxygenase large terminal subunit
MVYTPTRGDLPLRHGPGVRMKPDIGPSTLDASVYTDPDRFEREREKILQRSWQVVCRSSQIADAGDYIVWEGHGESVIVSRRPDGGVSGFHNVCQHRGARIVREGGCGARRFTCIWHDWVYDQEGSVVGVPERPSFDREQIKNLASPAVECDEWGGWVWMVLDGPGVAPTLEEWIGPEIVGDLGAYRMEDMRLVETLEWIVPVNYKAVIDGFNETYHAPALHGVPADDAKDGRNHSAYHVFERNAMMIVPYKGVLPKLLETRDHQATAICHYTIFPTTVFNNNPNHIQMFQAIPLTVDSTRFVCWELQYEGDDPEYRDGVDAHWERLKTVVAEDVDIFHEAGATKRSSAYRQNIFGDQECKLTHYHQVAQAMLDA